MISINFYFTNNKKECGKYLENSYSLKGDSMEWYLHVGILKFVYKGWQS